jgi:NAD(P)-dependent dehydrogenase (short-subunit alcohol dehydrogenase family)
MARTVVITGGTGGLGLATAKRLAARGDRVVVVGRDRGRGERAVAELAEVYASHGSGRAELVLADFSSLASVRAAAKEITERLERIDVLINNAATSSWGAGARSETADGFELFFASNYLAPYLLTRLLLPRLRGGTPARIVNIGASQMNARFDFDDLQLKKSWSEVAAITHAKLGIFCMTRSLAARFSPTELTSNVLDPGLVRTDYHAKAGLALRLVLRLAGKPAEQVAKAYEWIASAPELASTSGKMFNTSHQEVPFKGQAADDAVADRLWRESARLAGLPEEIEAPAPR